MDPVKTRDLIVYKASWLNRRPTESPVEWVPVLQISGRKRVDHSCICSSYGMWRMCWAILPILPAFVARCMIKQRKNFTCIFTFIINGPYIATYEACILSIIWGANDRYSTLFSAVKLQIMAWHLWLSRTSRTFLVSVGWTCSTKNCSHWRNISPLTIHWLYKKLSSIKMPACIFTPIWDMVVWMNQLHCSSKWQLEVVFNLH